jgi:uncharacterized protein (DUF433 family)
MRTLGLLAMFAAMAWLAYRLRKDSSHRGAIDFLESICRGAPPLRPVLRQTKPNQTKPNQTQCHSERSEESAFSWLTRYTRPMGRRLSHDRINPAKRGGAVGAQDGNKKGYEDRIIRDSKTCGGEPVFRGTRVTLRTVLASLAAGDTAEEILAAFPTLKPKDIQATIPFAAASAEKKMKRAEDIIGRYRNTLHTLSK